MHQTAYEARIGLPGRLLSLVYPRRCPLCHRVLKDQRRLICPDCVPKLMPIASPRCLKCGQPVAEQEEYCRDCRAVSHRFDQGRGIFLYTDLWKKSIEKYKYEGCREYADFYAGAMLRAAASELARWNPDVITGVPLYAKKERQRGFNQSWEIARRLSELLGVGAVKELVVKQVSTRDQKKLSRRQRMKNLEGAFVPRVGLHGERVLVVDDVYTTGSTMDAMAAALFAAGAGKVYFLTLCIAGE